MWNLARKLLLHDRLRFAVAIAGVSVSVMLVLVQVGLYFGFMDTASSLIDASRADIWVGKKSNDSFEFATPFDERTFVEDLRTARAVVSGGSFTTMSECVYLHKPLLSVPVKRQIEQVLNARWLEKLGYGMAGDAITDAGLARFLEHVPDLERGLAGYAQDGNRELLAKLDEVVAAAAGGGRTQGPARPGPA